MRIFEQQYENGGSSFYTNIPIYVPQTGEATENTKTYFEKLPIKFVKCEATTGNLTPTEWKIGCVKTVKERQLKNKVTGENFRADVSSNKMQFVIFKYDITDVDKEANEKDKEQNKVYTKAPVTAEVIAKRKADAYARKSQNSEQDTPLGDYISLDGEDLDEILPF